VATLILSDLADPQDFFLWPLPYLAIYRLFLSQSCKCTLGRLWPFTVGLRNGSHGWMLNTVKRNFAVLNMISPGDLLTYFNEAPDFDAVCGSAIGSLLANPAKYGSGKIFGSFSDLADFGTAAVHMDYLHLKVIKLVLACYDFEWFVGLTHSDSQWSNLK